jgi:putative membrane protein
MFLWTRPFGRKTFHMTAEFARSTRVLAANQGLYNGFLAAGLFIGAWNEPASHLLTQFTLVCVVIAGLYGGVTVSRKVFFLQALPALFALALRAQT